jgi:1-deoxy-D-xylulose-5-phosphate reductoisomerase
MRKITLIGSTGSIGQNSLAVIKHLGPDYRVVALAAHSQIDLLEQQAREFLPEMIAVYDQAKAFELQARLPHIPVLAGMEGLQAAASLSSADFVLLAMTGTLGLAPALAAINAGKTIGLANKEALVTGGALLTEKARQRGVSLLPIDSEHSAIFQCLQGEDAKSVRRLILTASGGPFRSYDPAQLAGITVDHALRHPTWKMGPKITVDCSTLMNKGLELIEAYWLFGLPVDKIEVVVHPQSLIHSMVEFDDLSVMAQMSEPSMTLPIQYALTYPHRKPGLQRPFDFTMARTLEFYPPDTNKFRCLHLAYEAIRHGESMPAYMNAANEILVERFINRQISWVDIGQKLEMLMNRHSSLSISSYEEIVEVDTLARNDAMRA